jgi:Fe-S-cluster containining protein
MKPWYAEGLRFQCQGSGKCCSSRGEYGFVYLTPEDARNMARELNLGLRDFKKLHCQKTDGALHLKDDASSPDCRFLKNNRCEVYAGRPVQCRTWPFWPENMKAKAWNKAVVEFCPGVGKGPVRDLKDIKSQMKEQKQADIDIWSSALLDS